MLSGSRREMKNVRRVLLATIVGVGLAAIGSLAGANPFGSNDDPAVSAIPPATPQIGLMESTDLEIFQDFPLYGLPSNFEGPRLNLSRGISPETLAEAAGAAAPVETLGDAPDTSGKGNVTPEFVSLIYGDCEATSDTGCSPPLEIQIWRSCNRSLDDYEITPGTPYPHEDAVVRGADAAQFDDRLEVYAGSVTIVIFGSEALARRAADGLVPLNDRAAAEMQSGAGDRLPAAAPKAECA